MVTYLLMCSTVLWMSGVWAGSRTFLPPTWKNVCNINITRLGLAPNAKLSEATTVLESNCTIRPSDAHPWRLNDLKNWTLYEKINLNTVPGKREIVYKLRVTCEGGANISLPWPMKIAGLEELVVSSCVLLDRYANFRNPVDVDQPDEMRILDLHDSQWLVGKTNDILSQSQGSMNINISDTYECGHDDTLEIFILRNISDILDTEILTVEIPVNRSTTTKKVAELVNPLPGELVDDVNVSGTVKPETRLMKDAEKVISDQINSNTDVLKAKLLQQNLQKSTPKSNTSDARVAEENFLDLLQKVFNTRAQCNYIKLRHLDESVAKLTPVTLFEFLVKDALYPVLEHMNFSTIGITTFPRELSEWRRFFPKLTYIDLSNNFISQVQFQNFPSKKDTGVVTFNLQRNNITVINMDVLNSWADIEKLEVDIRNNPIHCGCDLESFLPHLQDTTTFIGRLAPYEYVKEMECSTPDSLKGRKLYSLVHSSLPCPVYENHQAALIALGVTLSFLLVLVIILVRYKFEIRILLYTRLHVRLPCDADELRHSKTYDAFISYSNDDDSWVFENLVKFLENSSVPTSSQPTSNGTAHAKDIESKQRPNSAKTKPFRLCIHQRDFVPGKTIFDNIVDSIEASRHTIIVLSPSFMKSHWAMEELRQAYRQSLVEKTRHLVVLLLHKVPKEEMDPLIARCCKTFTYLDVNDTLFRDRLIFSLTTKDNSTRKRDKLMSKRKSAAKHSKRPEPPSPAQLESGAYDNVAYFPPASRPPDSNRRMSSHLSSAPNSLATQNGSKEKITPNSSQRIDSTTSSQMESGVYDSIVYYPQVSHPPEPLRVLSNMSTSSTSSLIR
ncbi:toll-like receptor 2 [Biomphalaria pfeifferi]|uniref:Toll-like receptor 2 n=1 Tax=Biomphalaria pfeifferi TaxID=112525 RepID=A0AAD8BZI8_BIOPF|nr:toll-like receptor 2 [Biomphalaria pfeifferi]